MGRFDNYPDDIRCYDHDPRSPFYEDPQEKIDEIAEERLDLAFKQFPAFFAQAERLGLTVGFEAEHDPHGWGEDEISVTVTLEGHQWGGQIEDLAHYAEAFAPLDREHPELKDQIEATML